MHPDLPAELAALTELLLGPDTELPPAPALVVASQPDLGPDPAPVAAEEAPFDQTASGLVDARRSTVILAELSFLDD